MRARPRCVARSITLVAFLAVARCGGHESSDRGPPSDAGPSPPASADAACRPGTLATAEGCLVAGVQANGCAAGEHVASSGSCAPAGIPPASCGAGFVSDGNGGCEPTLPATCATGTIATPGDAACREIAPCGTGPWPDVATDADAQFVDASYSAGASDGSAANPWTTIQAAIDAAAPGATVAIAAGSYAEDVAIVGKAVHLWGRCPGLVEVVGTSAAAAAIRIGDGADASEVHTLSVTGAAEGIAVQGAASVAIDRVRVHDTAWRGIEIHDTANPAGADLHGVLVDGAHRLGIWVEGAAVTFDGTVVRGTMQAPEGEYGDGVFVESDAVTGRRSKIAMAASVIEHNTKLGLLVAGSDASVERTVVRATRGDAVTGIGRGIQIQDKDAERARATVRTSFIDGSMDSGAFVIASDAVVEDTVVRNTTGGAAASGIGAIMAPDGRRSILAVRSCLVEQNASTGINVESSDATVENTIVRDTIAPTEDGSGAGIAAFNAGGTNVRATLLTTASLVEGSGDIGIFVGSSDATIEGTVVRGTTSLMQTSAGIGVQVDPMLGSEDAPTALVRSCLVEGNAGGNVVGSGANLTVEASVMSDGVSAVDGTAGRGITIQDELATGLRSHATVRGCVIRNNREAGALLTGSDVTIEDTLIQGTAPTPAGAFGVGIDAQDHAPARSNASVRSTIIESSSCVGLLVFNSDATVEGVEVKGVRPEAASGLYGDGVAVVSQDGGAATLALSKSLVIGATRAAVTNFGSAATLAETTMTCNPIQLDGEIYETRPFSFNDLGGNRCGCGGVDASCIAVSSSFGAPAPPSSP